MLNLGEIIAVARESKGWSQRDLERESGVSNALICQIETGKVKDPGFARTVQILDALGVSLDRAAGSVRRRLDVLRTRVIGRATGQEREGDQVPGMPGAICHGCGLGYKCMDPDCPNEKPNPAWP